MQGQFVVLLSGKREHVANEAAESLALGDDNPQVLRRLLITIGKLLFKQLGVHANVGEGRLQFVRDLIDEAHTLRSFTHLARAFAIEVEGEPCQGEHHCADARSKIEEDAATKRAAALCGRSKVEEAPCIERRVEIKPHARLFAMRGLVDSPLVDRDTVAAR